MAPVLCVLAALVRDFDGTPQAALCERLLSVLREQLLVGAEALQNGGNGHGEDFHEHVRDHPRDKECQQQREPERV